MQIKILLTNGSIQFKPLKEFFMSDTHNQLAYTHTLPDEFTGRLMVEDRDFTVMNLIGTLS